VRILRVADVGRVETAGMSGLMIESAAAMTAEGHTVTQWFRPELCPGLETPGWRRLLVPWLILLKVLREALSGTRFDLVEIHEPSAAPYALLTRLLPTRRLPACVILSHGLEERGWQARIASESATGGSVPMRSRILVPLTLVSQARVAIRCAEAVVVLSSQDEEHLTNTRGIPADRVWRCFTGVSQSLFEIEPTDRAALSVLFLGSWVDRKGVAELKTAWRQLGVEAPNARLTLAGVGEGPDVSRFAATTTNVAVLPAFERSELPTLLATHDVFVLPSWFEGMPVSMLEAAAAGLACVVSSVCGNVDVFRPDNPERDGALLVPPGDADALSRALVRLTHDARLRIGLGDRARDRARAFTIDKCADRLLAAYSAAVDMRSARAAKAVFRVRPESRP
jgi:glycosyltransferase involved in cell wall biosynthesis